MKNVVCLGVHVLDVHVLPVDALPRGSEGVLVDRIRLSPAGTAGGTAVVLAALGAAATSVGAVGSDAIGTTLVRLLAEHGVDTTGLAVKDTDQTSASVLPVSGDGDRPAWHCIGANALIGPEDVDLDLIAGADHLHVGGPEFLGETAVTALAHARAHGVSTSADMLAPGEPMWLEAIAPCLPYVDQFLPNDEQLLGLTGESSLEAAVKVLLDLGIGVVAATAGAQGAFVSGVGLVPAYDVPVVDTTGCGDAFSAGFLLGRLLGRTSEDAARLGNATAAQVVQGLATDVGGYDLASVEAFLASAPTR